MPHFYVSFKLIPYWILFLYSAYFGLTQSQLHSEAAIERHWRSAWWTTFLLLIVIVGLRDEVGGDWGNYLNHLDRAVGESFQESLFSTDPAYAVLNWVGAQWGGVYFVNLVCAGIFSWGLIEFCRSQPFPWLSFVAAVPYLIIVVAMGYTRQSVAIGFAMLALVSLARGSASRFVFWIICAALFHKSAVILAPLAVLASTKRRLLMMVWITFVSIILFVLLLQESIDNFRYGYLEQEMQSSGAAIRIAMNALPALIFLLFRGRFNLSPANEKFWTWMSLGALLFIALLYISPSSTAVDRIALYWIPIQLFVLSRAPLLLKSFCGGATLVVAYSAAVLGVWLFFAENALYWLPYKSSLLRPFDWF